MLNQAPTVVSIGAGPDLDGYSTARYAGKKGDTVYMESLSECFHSVVFQEKRIIPFHLLTNLANQDRVGASCSSVTNSS